jgi:glycosyltransferase involved in cell wall biosynthesis
VQLVALVEAPDHVCCRYRLAAFRPHLERAGHALALCPLPAGWLARWRLFRSLAGASVILQRKLLPGWQLALLRRHVRHLLFDLDDAVFLRDSYSRRGLHHPGRLRRFAATARACDAVVAGNAFLAEQAARWAGPGRVHVIPTCVDPDRYSPRWAGPPLPPLSPEGRGEPKAGDGKTLVWVGSSSTLQGLEAIGELLEGLGRAVPGLRLKVICDRFPAFARLPVLPRPWSEEAEAAEIASGDVGISWVPDDLWSRGKCGLKVLQYMAAGLPVVANPVGVHAEMVVHCETGYLATTPQEWLDAVGRLASDAALRSRLGRAGRERLEDRYGVAAGAGRWLEVLDRLQRAPLRRVG